MLSKSDILNLRQCPRMLWLTKNKPELVPEGSSSKERRTMDGHLVNNCARAVLGEHTLWPTTQDSPEESMAAALRELAKNPERAVLEMPMIREGLYARADALAPVKSGWALQETKASTFPLKADKKTPAKPDAHFVEDLAIQAWVADATGLPIGQFDLNLLDSRWTYQGDNDYAGLFRLYNLNEQVAELKPQVPIWLQEAKDVLDGDMPEATTGRQCKKPYDCNFAEFCTALEPEPVAHPVELLPDLAGKNLARELRNEDGIESLLDVPTARLLGNNEALYLRIQKAHTLGHAIHTMGSKEVLDGLPYPRYFFDFEGIDLPVPRWNGVRPYEQIPFQWSCHIERAPGVFEHKAFLDVSGQDPSLACIHAMREAIDENDGGPLLVFFKTYEKGRLEGLGERFPEFRDVMDKYIARLVDLLPLVKNSYYHPDMEGSFSIKKVLPTIAPELDYSELEGVQEGTGAQIAYLEACFENLGDTARATLVRNMLSYCEQDTWAMVVLAMFLTNTVCPARPAPDWAPLMDLNLNMTRVLLAA